MLTIPEIEKQLGVKEAGGAEALQKRYQATTTLNGMLWHAVKKKNVAAIQGLIAANANPKITRSVDNATPLHEVAMAGLVGALDSLLSAHANINARDRLHRTPLVAALGTWEAGTLYIEETKKLEEPHKQIATALIRAKADVTIPDDKGQTALHYVVTKNKYRLNEFLPLVRLLVRSHANVNALSKKLNTPLYLVLVDPHWGSSCSATIKTLVQAKADLTLKGEDSRTPLQQAIEQDDSHQSFAATILFLMGNGAKFGFPWRSERLIKHFDAYISPEIQPFFDVNMCQFLANCIELSFLEKDPETLKDDPLRRQDYIKKPEVLLSDASDVSNFVWHKIRKIDELLFQYHGNTFKRAQQLFNAPQNDVENALRFSLTDFISQFFLTPRDEEEFLGPWLGVIGFQISCVNGSCPLPAPIRVLVRDYVGEHINAETNPVPFASLLEEDVEPKLAPANESLNIGRPALTLAPAPTPKPFKFLEEDFKATLEETLLGPNCGTPIETRLFLRRYERCAEKLFELADENPTHGILADGPFLPAFDLQNLRKREERRQQKCQKIYDDWWNSIGKSTESTTPKTKAKKQTHVGL